MAVTRWPDVVDQLVARMRATPGYRSPWATTGTADAPVYDSVEVAMQTAPTTSKFLVIAYGGDPDNLRDAGRAGQKFDTLGTNRGRKETGLVTCLAVAQSGAGGEHRDGMSSTVRSDARQIVTDVGNALRVPADGPTLGIAAPRIVVEMGDRMEFWPILNQGITWQIIFDVKYSTAI